MSLKTYFGMRLFLDLSVILTESYAWDFAFYTHWNDYFILLKI